ncbi:MAG: ABC transporter ATP-binding protein [Polaromonas sp.]|nr:ABC transporter ATP-binding protein [Polaromonas sp.]
MSKLIIRELTKQFEVQSAVPLLALDTVNLEIQEGEFVAFVGPSGCGKTTMLRIIQGLESASSGEILIDGKAVNGPGHDRSFVFQQYGLLPWLTAGDNLDFALQAKGITEPARKEAIERALELVGLKGFSDHYPHQLSGGMQQRIGIARALAVEPDMLLMDEPFGALDALTREVLQNEMLQLTERMKKTVLFVTHSVDEAVCLADRVVVMSPRPGRIREIVLIDIPRPRAALGAPIREMPEYVHKRNLIWDLLMEVI